MNGIILFLIADGSLALKGFHRVKRKADGQQLPLDAHQAGMERVRERIYLHLLWAEPHYQTAFQLEDLS